MEHDVRSRGEARRATLEAIRALRATGVDPALAEKLDTVERALGSVPGRDGKKAGQRRQFGAFAGRFKVGPEFFETHALLWFAAGDSRLPQAARHAIETPSNAVFVNAASAWEIAAKYRKGKLPEAGLLIIRWTEALDRLGFSDMPVTSAHAVRAGLLDLRNADPFDRMILAQALMENLIVVSNEADWDSLGVVRLWKSEVR